MTLATILTAALLSQQTHCLATTVYREARGESYSGQVAVALVVRNRVLSDKFPDTPCQVMVQPRQFAFVSHDLHLADPMDGVAWETDLRASQDVLAMPIHAYERPMQNSLYFHSGNKPLWDFTKLEEVVTIGEHTFYRDKDK